MSQAEDRVVLLEITDEAEAWVERCRRLEEDPSAATVISLDPKVLVWLRRHDVKCVNSISYFDTGSHTRALRKSIQLLGWLETRIELEDGLGIRQAYTGALLWYSRYNIHHFLWICEILAEVLSQHPNADIYAPVSTNVPNTRPLLGDAERYLGPIAEEYCRLRGVDFHAIAIAPASVEPGRGSAPAGLVKRSMIKLGGHFHRSVLRRMGRKRPLLAFTHTYRMDWLVNQASSQAPELPWAVMGEGASGLRPAAMLRRVLQATAPGPWATNGHPYVGEAWLRVLERTTHDDAPFVAALSRTMEDLAVTVEADTEVFSHRGVPFGTQYAAKVRSGIAPAIKLVHREIRAFDELLTLLRPRLVVTPFGRRAAHGLGELCGRRGIPGLLISHGSFTSTKDELARAAWAFHADGLFHGSYSHAALQSPLAEEYSREMNSPAKFVRTGPLVWGGEAKREGLDTLKTRLLNGNAHCRVLLHAGTVKSRSSTHFYVYETLDEYIAGISDLVTAVNEIPNTFLIIKAKADPLTQEELRSLLPPSERYSISVEEPFLDVLGLADLLVSFASTTIEEALQNRVPVLHYGGEGRYHHVEAVEVAPGHEVAPGPVYKVRRRDHLADAIRRIFEANGKAPLPPEMFEKYVYKPEDITPFPQLVRALVEG